MTDRIQQIANAVADEITVLLDRALIAAKAEQWVVSGELLRQAKELAKTLPQKKDTLQ